MPESRRSRNPGEAETGRLRAGATPRSSRRDAARSFARRRRRPFRAKVRSTTRRRRRTAKRSPSRPSASPRPQPDPRRGPHAGAAPAASARNSFRRRKSAPGPATTRSRPARRPGPACPRDAPSHDQLALDARHGTALAPLAFLQTSRPLGPPPAAVFADRLSITPAVGAFSLPARLLPSSRRRSRMFVGVPSRRQPRNRLCTAGRGGNPSGSARRWRAVAGTCRTASAASRGSAVRGHPVRPCTGGIDPITVHSPSVVACGRSSGLLRSRRASSDQDMAVPFHGCSGARMRPFRQWRSFP